MLFLTSAASRGLALSRVQNVIRTSKMFASRRSTQGRHILTLRQNVSATVSRWFSREMPRLPLDAENLASMITKDITVFTYTNKRFFLMMTIFGGMQFLFWANLAAFIESYPVSKNSKPQVSQKSSTSWMDTFYAENRTKIAAACVCLGGVMLFVALSYPLRSVSRLTLLKGGRNVEVTTYWHFGRTRQFTVPLDDVSCQRSRMSSPSYAAMKISGRWMHFLLDTRDGKFHYPELFDYVIALNRSFK